MKLDCYQRAVLYLLSKILRVMAEDKFWYICDYILCCVRTREIKGDLFEELEGYKKNWEEFRNRKG